jgi:serine/threonine protein phosphatase PrpC/MFS family permease
VTNSLGHPKADGRRESRLGVAAQSSTGRVRRNNEDAFVVASLGEARRRDATANGVFDTTARTLLLAVSDGVGGNEAGEVASARVVDALHRSLPLSSSDWEGSLRTAVEQANREVWAIAQRPETHGAAATLTAVCVHDADAYVAEVGDSRAYLLRDRQLRPLTHDQTYVQFLVDQGVLNPQDANESPLKNVILSAMGQDPDVRVDITHVKLELDDRILVCSDGLSKEVSDDRIAEVLADAESPTLACSRLIASANENGGRDNITVIVAHVGRTAQAQDETHRSQMRTSAENAPRSWLSRTVWGMTVTSFLSDLGHEAQSTLLPTFMSALGLPPAALGLVEGAADAASSFIKLGSGWLSDRLGIRKAFVVGGYAATGLASGIIAMASGLPLILGGKLFGWLGRGVRGPLRDAMLSDSIPEEARGRAFGFHRFGDTLGAIVGPLLAVSLLSWLGDSNALRTTRLLIAWSLVPGVLSAFVFAAFVRERARTPSPHHTFRHSLRRMPAPFRRYLLGVGVFGAGDFAHTMLILAATQLLSPRLGTLRAATLAGALYVLHNVIYAAAAYPAGALADRHGHRRILAFGYAASVAVPLAMIWCFLTGTATMPVLAGAFALAGLVNGVQDTLEGAATAGLVPENDRGLGFGVLGAVNGVGDLTSSLLVGLLWTAHPAFGFGFAALCMAAGAAITAAGSAER